MRRKEKKNIDKIYDGKLKKGRCKTVIVFMNQTERAREICFFLKKKKSACEPQRVEIYRLKNVKRAMGDTNFQSKTNVHSLMPHIEQ